MSETATAQAAPGLGARAILQMPNFRRLWLGQFISDFGDALTNLALLVLINQLTGSTAALALMAIVLAVPQITFGLLAGVYVDRLDRRRLMIVSDVLRAMLVLGFVFVGSADQIWLLYVLGFAQATVGTFFTPARSAMIPALVPREGLIAANSLSQTTRVLCGVLGTGAAGVLIGTAAVFWPIFLADALTFLASALLISRIRNVESAPAPAAPGTPRVILGELTDGLRLILRNRPVLGALVGAAMTMLGLGAVNVLSVPFLLNDLHVPATWFGAIDLAQTVSMILSGSLVAVLARRWQPARMLTAGLFLLGIEVALIAAVGHIAQLLLLLFLVGWVVPPVQAAIATITQVAVPAAQRGRVAATLSMLVSTANVVSMALAGGFAQAIGLRNSFLLGGACVVLAAVAAAWVFRGRSISAPQPEPAPAP